MQSVIYAASAALLARTVLADEYTGQGNVDLTIKENDPIFIGDHAPWDVIATLRDHCNSLTCTAESWTIPTILTNSASGLNSPTNSQDGTITVTVVDATIANDGDRDFMISALDAMARQPQLYGAKPEKYCSGDIGGGVPVAPGKHRRAEIAASGRGLDGTYPVESVAERQASCDVNGDIQSTQFSVPGTYYVRINDVDHQDALRSALRIQIEAGVNDDTLSSTMCTSLATAGAAISGLFTAGAGAAAGFSLAGLACGSL